MGVHNDNNNNCSRSYSYYIEVSVDQKDWERIVDHTRYNCRSWQYLYFEPRVVRYIRIVGTNNTVNKVFHVVTFEIMYTNKTVCLEKGLIGTCWEKISWSLPWSLSRMFFKNGRDFFYFAVPKQNVATSSLSASVIEGVSRTRNSLLDGNTQFYDWESGYTCHQLGSGCILIQLGQPYLIDSMRLITFRRIKRPTGRFEVFARYEICFFWNFPDCCCGTATVASTATSSKYPLTCGIGN